MLSCMYYTHKHTFHASIHRKTLNINVYPNITTVSSPVILAEALQGGHKLLLGYGRFQSKPGLHIP